MPPVNPQILKYLDSKRIKFPDVRMATTEREIVQEDISNGESKVCKYAVGEKVRVLSMKGDHSRRGVISIAQGEAQHAKLVGPLTASSINLYDVIYDSGEELNVPEFRIMPLERFETLPPSPDAEVLKEQGNTLFAHKDFTEAIKFYQRALHQLEGSLITVGNTVIVIPANNICNYPNGLVALVEGETLEIMINDDYGDDEIKTTKDKVVCVADAHPHRMVQLSVYKNLSRCAAKQQRNGWALRYANLAVAIARTIPGESSRK